jgi:hypothetical protein
VAVPEVVNLRGSFLDSASGAVAAGPLAPRSQTMLTSKTPLAKLPTIIARFMACLLEANGFCGKGF